MSFVDLLFPKFCLSCHLPGTYLCPRCQKNLKYIDNNRCFFCKKTSLYNLTHPSCLNKFNIEGVGFIFYYNPLLKRLIKNIKYRLATDIWEELSKGIYPEVTKRLAFYNKLIGKMFLQPIPLSTERLRSRGFNQALLITRFFQKFINLPIADFLIRIKNTSSQADLKSRKLRYQNMRGAFRIRKTALKEMTGANIILVDDVVTTGSTVKEAARILKKSGAGKIYVLALAKG